MKKIMSMILLLTFLLSSLTGCSIKNNSSKLTYTKITAKEAKEMMDNSNDVIILDVRTEAEFNEGHIEDAILIPDSEIDEKAESTLNDKTATILVYCRSGRRSALASESLASLGYTNVYDFGGIIDWDYKIVTE